MKDIRVISARHILKVHSVAPVRQFLPPSVVVLGADLNKASEVFYNGIKADEFIAQSATRMVVRIPEAALGKPFVEIQVLSSVPLSQQDAVVELVVPSPLQSVQGIDRLVQVWIMEFLKTPGSDVFDMEGGGGGASLIGQPSSGNGQGVAADLAMAAERTRNNILKRQARITGIPLGEKLLESSLSRITFDKSTGTLSAHVSLRNMLGEQADVAVG